MTIRLVACDLDGTLIGPDLTFSPRLLDAVRRVRERGIVVTIATGRGFPSTRIFARRLEVDAPLICYQGAQIVASDGCVLYQAPLSRALLPEVVDFAAARACELSVYCKDRVYQTTQYYERDFYDRWFGLPMQHVNALPDDLPGAPVKFIVIAPDQEDADRLEDELRVLAWFVEGLARGVSKGDALARLARWLGVVREQVMALGDSGNDAAMVEWAGVGVAMGNAVSATLAAADVIAPTFEEDGAAWAIERYVLAER